MGHGAWGVWRVACGVWRGRGREGVAFQVRKQLLLATYNCIDFPLQFKLEPKSN